jgi:hypothetical protein
MLRSNTLIHIPTFTARCTIVIVIITLRLMAGCTTGRMAALVALVSNVLEM